MSIEGTPTRTDAGNADASDGGASTRSWTSPAPAWPPPIGKAKPVDGRRIPASPLATAGAAKQIVAANYDEHLALLKDFDLVIEAISERMDWKKALFEKVAPHIGANAIFASNTSGLSITELSKTLPAELRK